MQEESDRFRAFLRSFVSGKGACAGTLATWIAGMLLLQDKGAWFWGWAILGLIPAFIIYELVIIWAVIVPVCYPLLKLGVIKMPPAPDKVSALQSAFREIRSEWWTSTGLTTLRSVAEKDPDMELPHGAAAGRGRIDSVLKAWQLAQTLDMGGNYFKDEASWRGFCDRLFDAVAEADKYEVAELYKKFVVGPHASGGAMFAFGAELLRAVYGPRTRGGFLVADMTLSPLGAFLSGLSKMAVAQVFGDEAAQKKIADGLRAFGEGLPSMMERGFKPLTTTSPAPVPKREADTPHTSNGDLPHEEALQRAAKSRYVVEMRKPDGSWVPCIVPPDPEQFNDRKHVEEVMAELRRRGPSLELRIRENQIGDETITFSCGECGKRISVSSNLAGRPGRCPRCKAKVIAPGAAAAAVPKAPQQAGGIPGHERIGFSRPKPKFDEGDLEKELADLRSRQQSPEEPSASTQNRERILGAEDVRAFLAARRMHHYAFAHLVLRSAFFAHPARFFATFHLGDKSVEILRKLWKEVGDEVVSNGHGAYVNADGLHADLEWVGSRPCLLFELPTPVGATEAYMVAAVVNGVFADGPRGRLHTLAGFPGMTVGLTTDHPDCMKLPASAPKGFYFTLEKGVNDDGIPMNFLCSWIGETHKNYGVGLSTEKTEFLAAVERALSSEQPG